MQTMYPGQPNSPQTELAADITADDTTIPLLNAAALPPAPNLAVIGTDETAETVLYTGVEGNNLTGVTRGFQGVARSWSAGAKVARNFTAYDYDALRQNVEEMDQNVGTIQSNLNNHIADYVRQPGYAAATGSANAYAVTLDPAPTGYVDGMAVAVKINVDNTGASTLNVNGLGAKPIKKPNGNDVAAGNLKAGSIYTFRYNGANFILQAEGGYGIGDDISRNALSFNPSKGLGAEVWSKTDVTNGQGVAVDAAGNVYCAHNVGSGKAIRKLDSAGNEVWSKTDVASGFGVAVDAAGNVYCAHNVGSGKAIRKLDSAGNEVWSKTDVGNGRGVAVDAAGNVYCAHNVTAGEKAVRKLDSAGNEVWSKTDVGNGRGVAVDAAGNVYCAHFVSSGQKAIRKLDSAGNEVWSKTDVANGQGIAIDAAGNVYCAHNVGSGKAIRKLDSAGNEVWSKTDVITGTGVAVDSMGNVYATHTVPAGQKAIRKLDSSGNEIWSKTDVASGMGVAVDEAGNVYVAHNVGSGGKAIRKLDGNEYYTIIK